MGHGALQQHVDVGRAPVLAAVAAGEGEIALQHRLHVVDVLVEGGDVGLWPGQR